MKKVIVLMLILLFSSVLFAERKDYNFISYDFEGNFFQLRNFIEKTKSDYIVIDFFNIYCEPCKKALPEWQKKYSELKEKKIEFILVTVPSEKQNAKEEKPLVKTFLKNGNFTFTILYDLSFYVAKLFKVAQKEKDSMTVTVPQIFIIDSKMQIVSKSEDFDAALKQINELNKSSVNKIEK